MVKPGIQTLAVSGSEPSVESWLESVLSGRADEERDVIRRAAARAIDAHHGQQRRSGEPYVVHAFAVATILHELGLDHEAIAAALLHDVVEDTAVTLEQVKSEFGPRVAHLVDGVTKMDVIQGISDVDPGRARETLRVESLRKMLLAMVEDVRVVLIKLADRLHNLRTLKHLAADRQVAIARETLDIYAPLANRLGVWQLKWELEDLSLRYLEPDAYKTIAAKLAERRVDRETYIQEFIADLSRELDSANIRAEVSGRPKHIFSIWNKMRRKAIDFEHITDIRGVRILVHSVQDCYAALGVVHTRWSHIAGEFDDYIATPKENNYRSIHTAVIGPDGKIIEVQIRTVEMHELNELGVAAHWRYKEGVRTDTGLDRKILWLRQLLEWKDEVASANQFVDRIKDEVFEDRVYVFTPNGKVMDLPAGATPIDFAYAVHTEVGHRCRGAKVNGKMVPLTCTLKTGEQVEILTVRKGGPSRDWLSPHLGYVRTSRARNRIQHWFRQENYDEYVASGRHLLERELHRLGQQDASFERLARSMGFSRVEEMFIRLADGDLKVSRVVAAAQEMSAGQETVVPLTSRPRQKREEPKGDEFEILGVGNLLTHLAACCNPLPGDAIAGYITRGRGVTVHRQDCSNVLRFRSQSPERVVDVAWGTKGGTHYPVDLRVTSFDRQGLLRDISALLADAHLNVLSVNTSTDKRDNIAHMVLTVEVSDIQNLNQVMNRIRQLANVIDVRRAVN